MAKGALTDFFGLAGTELKLTGGGENQSIQVVEAVDERGDQIAIDTYEQLKAPTNDFSVAADFDCTAITLGTLKDNDALPGFVLTGFSINTGAGQAPTVSVSGEQVPTGSTQSNTYTTPAMTLKKDHKAQILFAAFTLSGSGVHLNTCSATGSCTLTRAYDDNAETIAWDVSKGQIEVTGEIVKSGETAPIFAAAANWTVVSPLTLTESNADYEKFSFTLRYTPASVAPGA